MKKTISLSAKCSDLFNATIMLGADGYDIEGYVPEGLGIGGGDYIELTIDLKTGKILNWVPPTDESIQNAIGEDGEDDVEDDDVEENYEKDDDGEDVFLGVNLDDPMVERSSDENEALIAIAIYDEFLRDKIETVRLNRNGVDLVITRRSGSSFGTISGLDLRGEIIWTIVVNFDTEEFKTTVRPASEGDLRRNINALTFRFFQYYPYPGGQ